MVVTLNLLELCLLSFLCRCEAAPTPVSFILLMAVGGGGAGDPPLAVAGLGPRGGGLLGAGIWAVLAGIGGLVFALVVPSVGRAGITVLLLLDGHGVGS